MWVSQNHEGGLSSLSQQLVGNKILILQKCVALKPNNRSMAPVPGLDQSEFRHHVRLYQPIRIKPGRNRLAAKNFLIIVTR